MVNEKVGVKLEDYQLTTAQAVLIDLMKELGYGEIKIRFQNGDPVQVMENWKSHSIPDLVRQRREAEK